MRKDTPVLIKQEKSREIRISVKFKGRERGDEVHSCTTAKAVAAVFNDQHWADLSWLVLYLDTIHWASARCEGKIVVL